VSLEPGSRLGHYEIVETVPGAVSESYKAADTRSSRTVTLKAYPQHVWDNASVKQQLEREIQSVAALKHPHIVAPTEIVHEAGADYLVTDYVEGETLAERLKRGPLEVEEALAVAVAIADALDKAHRQGVVHRGLNPSTVVLTAAGAKLIDFGFAKVNEPSGAALPVSALSARTTRAIAPSVSAPAFAAPYLAPEQIAGTDAEACADIFAFGAVLYEMLTGRPAFEGKTSPILAAAIQTVDPEPVSKLRAETPPALEYAVKRCLAKDPKQRFRTARDLTKHLQWIADGGDRMGATTLDVGARKRDRWLFVAAAAIVLVTVSLALAAYRYFAVAAEAAEVRYVISSMSDTANATGGSPVTVSPDGRWITGARLTNTSGGIYALPMGAVTPKVLLDGHIAWAFFWAPDSKSFGFFEDGKLKTSDVSGSPPQTLSDAPLPIGGGAWGTRGVIVFASGGVLHKVQAAGGQPAQMTTLDPSLQESDHLAPYFLPDGVHYLYLALSTQPSNSAVYVGSIDSKERTRLFASESPAIYAAPGYLLFNRASAVFAQPFDAGALKVTGEAIRLPDAALRLGAGNFLSPNETKLANVAVSQTGVLAYRSASSAAPGQPQAPAGLTLVWFDRSGGATGVATSASYAGVDLAPDGKRFSVHQHEGDGGDSWFFDSGRMQRLTFNTAQDNAMPIWSYDGTKIAFGSRRNGKWGVYVKASDGTGQEELIVESELTTMPMSWSPDGKLLVYWVNDPKTRGDLWMVPVSGDRKPVALLQTPADESLAQVSPDGKWMAYQSDETGSPQIYVLPFPSGSGNKSQISTDGGAWPRWRGDGKELFFNLPPNIMAADIRVSGQSVQPGVPRVLFPHGNPTFNVTHTAAYHRYAVSADGQRFLMPQPAANPLTGAGGLAATVASFVDGTSSGAAISNVGSINVMLNWTQGLKKK
jgi:eukaryotic-like serine/threonine-protein kinase